MSESEGWNLGRISSHNQDALPGAIRLRLPATSANLGPGFDAVGVALKLALTIEAQSVQAPQSTELTIAATGRDAERCARTTNNMIFETYREVLTGVGRELVPLDLRIHNEIPLGMGCGSSAAARLGGVMLANHFGGLDWSQRACIEEATRREGHPDNVAACALGYVTVSVVAGDSECSVHSATFGQQLPWKLLLAFALGRGDLLRVAMQDRMHQPYRMEACPLLDRLLPLAGGSGVLGVALSGAGPGVLLVVEADIAPAEIAARIRQAAGEPELEIIATSIGAGATVESI